MFKTSGTKIQMVEGDFGVVLPISIILGDGETLTNNDTFSFKIYKATNDELLIEKTLTPTNNTINFELTEEESVLLPVGKYKYDLEWTSNNFLNSIVANEKYVVIEKAGVVNGD